MKLLIAVLAAALLAGCCSMTGDGEGAVPAQSGGEVVPPDDLPGGSASAAGSQFSVLMYDTEDPVEEGGTTYYMVQVENIGAYAEDMELDFSVSDEMRLVSGYGGYGDYSVSGSTARWRIDGMKSGEVATLRLVAEAVSAGSAVATATVGAGTGHEVSVSEGTSVYG